MIKYMGLILLVSAFASAGLCQSSKLMKRVRILEEFKQLMSKALVDIRYRMPLVQEIFSTVTASEISTLTSDISDKLQSGLSLEESVESAFCENTLINALMPDEKIFIKNALSSFGTTDLEGQTAMLKSTLNQLDVYIQNAVEFQKKNSKVYLTVSLYAGLALAIFLI